ncbi:hypothetical protein SAMN05216392_0360 [Streptococcus equinus]|uniref:Uncharacterized protein n=1 Tax=Streptococcus equinus TaxID=1335 RepID=A0A1H0Y1D3_STREI|nr:hypothetical protein [Streptococcus equinus]SDQ08999.1 hypothetical protein SAMN05216392_0360 [Streptococcus equinus]
MKEFKEIIDGIAHSLNMTVDSLVKAYPHLRTEYSWYYACTTVQIVFGALLFLGLCGTISTFIHWVYNLNDYHCTEKQIDNSLTIFTMVMMTTLVIFAIFLISCFVKGFTSPDVMIINKVIGTISCRE